VRFQRAAEFAARARRARLDREASVSARVDTASDSDGCRLPTTQADIEHLLPPGHCGGSLAEPCPTIPTARTLPVGGERTGPKRWRPLNNRHLYGTAWSREGLGGRGVLHAIQQPNQARQG
jgi:hypothetical protein